jgi:hypothetical protein
MMMRDEQRIEIRRAHTAARKLRCDTPAGIEQKL